MPKRHRKRRKMHKGFALVALFIISLFSLSLGMGLCLTKSPETKAEFYLAMAAQYQEKAEAEILQPQAQAYLLQQSREFVSKAIGHDPYDPRSWESLTLILAQLNLGDQAMQARDIAMMLGMSDLPTIASMQALLPERNFALSNSFSSKTIMR